MAVKPGFGTPRQVPSYYESVSVIIRTLREFSSLSTIARALNQQGFRSPTGKPFNVQLVANFIRSSQYQPA